MADYSYIVAVNGCADNNDSGGLHWWWCWTMMPVIIIMRTTMAVVVQVVATMDMKTVVTLRMAIAALAESCLGWRGPEPGPDLVTPAPRKPTNFIGALYGLPKSPAHGSFTQYIRNAAKKANPFPYRAPAFSSQTLPKPLLSLSQPSQNPFSLSLSLSAIKLELFKHLRLGKSNASNTKVWIVVGITVAGVLILAETTRRRRRRSREGLLTVEGFGAFLERFELAPAPQPPPPAARHPLADLTFAVSDNLDVKGFVSGFGNPDWERTHDPASRSAVVVSCLLKHGAACIGKTVMDELAFGVTGENLHYGTPVNPELRSQIPGGSSSGSAVSVAAELADFALGTDTVGCVRIPASFCGIFGFRPSHGTASNIGVLTNSQSLDTVGWFARDPSILHRVGHILLPATPVVLRRARRYIFADDCFQFLRVPKQKSVHVISKAIETLSGYQPPKHMNIGLYIATNVPSLKEFHEPSSKMQQGISTLKALSMVMISLQKYEFKTNHEEWINTVKPRIGLNISTRVLAAVNSSHENVKSLYKVRSELRSALNSLLKDDGILVIPTTPDFPVNVNSKKNISPEFEIQLFTLLSIAGISGCCQVTVPLGKHNGYPISISFISAHGADKFLLDTVLDMYPSLQKQIDIASNLVPAPDVNGDMDVSELLKEKGNAAFKGRQWNRAVNFYCEAIKLNDTNATYYCNRAAAYLELGCFQQAEADCNQAILLDKKNVKAYLRRGTAREMLLYYKEAAHDFKHALVLEPQNKAALAAEKRLKKLMR